MRRLVSTILFLSSATLLVRAQPPGDEAAAVRKTIEDHYFKAHATGDGAFLKGTFIDEGRMMWVQDGQGEWKIVHKTFHRQIRKPS
jgi:hypothetical protein